MMIWLAVSVASRSAYDITSIWLLYVCLRVCMRTYCVFGESVVWKVCRWEVENVRTCVFPLQHIHQALYVTLYAHIERFVHTHTFESMAKKSICRDSYRYTWLVCKCVYIQTHVSFGLVCKRACWFALTAIYVVFVCIETASHSSHSFLNASLQLQAHCSWLCI